MQVSTHKSTHKKGITSSTEEKALSLLGSGVSSEAVASALGVSPSAISQLLSKPEFASEVSELRYKTLRKHNRRDEKYDNIEDKLVGKLEAVLPMMFQPAHILNAIKVINNAKRRGQDSPSSAINQVDIVTLLVPVKIAQEFSVNINNQVVKAGDQSLLTMQSKTLLDRVEKRADE